MQIIHKPLLAIAAYLMVSSSAASGAVLLAGWDSWTSATAPAPTVVAGFISATTTASTSAGNWSAGETATNAGRGSSGDGTWGTFDGAGTAPSTSTSLQADNYLTTNGRASSEITFTLTNSGTSPLNVEAFHMDALRWRPNAVNTYTLTVESGAITNGAVTGGSGSLTNRSGAALTTRDLHDDINIALTGLADHTLDPGESAVIRISFTGGTGDGSGHHFFLDNVAFSGSVIPEPSAVALGGLATLALLRRRRS